MYSPVPFSFGVCTPSNPSFSSLSSPVIAPAIAVSFLTETIQNSASDCTLLHPPKALALNWLNTIPVYLTSWTDLHNTYSRSRIVENHHNTRKTTLRKRGLSKTEGCWGCPAFWVGATYGQCRKSTHNGKVPSRFTETPVWVNLRALRTTNTPATCKWLNGLKRLLTSNALCRVFSKRCQNVSQEHYVPIFRVD